MRTSIDRAGSTRAGKVIEKASTPTFEFEFVHVRVDSASTVYVRRARGANSSDAVHMYSLMRTACAAIRVDALCLVVSGSVEKPSSEAALFTPRATLDLLRIGCSPDYMITFVGVLAKPQTFEPNAMRRRPDSPHCGP